MDPAEILAFWFAGDPSTRRKAWFEKDHRFDAECARFAPALASAREGAFDDWAHTPRGALALLILLDQLSRNLFRGSAKAFAADGKARAVARAAVERGFDLELTAFERMFIYLPFEHSETMADQDESVRLFEMVRPSLGDETLRYTHEHRNVIRQLGRFPHRNAALGRENTTAEDAYLAQPGAGF